MSAEDNKKAVQAAYEGFQRGDMEPLFSILSDDFVFENYEDNPFGGRYHGRAAFEHLDEVLAQVDLHKTDIEAVIADDDIVVVIVDIGYTVKATGKSNPDGPTVHIMNFEDGMMTRFRELAVPDGGAWKP